jgi:hypothetical protein
VKKPQDLSPLQWTLLATTFVACAEAGLHGNRPSPSDAALSQEDSGLSDASLGSGAEADADLTGRIRPDAPSGGDATDAAGLDAADCSCAADEICFERRCKSRGTPVVPTFAPCTQPPCIDVHNACPVPLWIHALATVPIDDGNVRRLAPGESWRYPALPPFGGGRLYAYYEEPANKRDTVRLVSDKNQFVEMTVDQDPATSAWAQNYNISYVDYLSLPVSMKATGASCQETVCGAAFGDWKAKLHECPTDLRNEHDGIATCTGSFNYCMTPDGASTYDATHAYCTQMQAAHGFPGSTVYGGYFPDHPATEVQFWDGVAAWNRGTFAGDADESHYYVHAPYNDYARWIHRGLGCANVYAFSTDDHQDKAGFVRCVAPVLQVIWCPYG